MGNFFIAVGVVYVAAILVQIACYRSSLKKGAVKSGAEGLGHGAAAGQGCH